MKKSDLKTGMVIEYRNGQRFLIIIEDSKINKFQMFEDHIDIIGDLGNWGEDLINKGSIGESLDVVKVYDYNYVLLWEREESNEYTIEQLEKLTGITNLKIKK